MAVLRTNIVDSGLGIGRQLGEKNCANVGKGIMNTKGKIRMWEVRKKTMHGRRWW